MRKWVRGLLIGLATALSGLLLALTPPGGALERNVGLAWLFKIRGPVEPPADVAVVAIDSSTGSRLDLPRLPRDWSRAVHGELIEALVEENASIIVFDMDFSRPKSGYEDSMFGRAISDADRVVLFEPLEGKRVAVEKPDGSHGGWTWVEERRAPAPSLALAAKAIGPFPLPKLGQAAFEFWAFKASTGDAPTTAAIALQLYALPVYDRWRALLEQAGAQGLEELPTWAAEIDDPADVRALMATLRRAFEADPGLGDRIRGLLGVRDGAPPASPEDRLLVALTALYEGPTHLYLNFYGPPGTIRTVPYHRLVARESAAQTIAAEGSANAAPDAGLADKVVFVGYSDLYDPDQPDRFYTVFTGRDGVDLSGVEIMATAFANLLTGSAVRPIEPWAALSVLGVFGLVIGAGAYLLPAMIGVPLVLTLAAGYGFAAQGLFNEANLWLPAAAPLLVQLPLALLLGLMGQYLLERHHGRRMGAAISHYVPAHIIKELVEGNVTPESVNKVVYGTCFANDMSGFSTIAETKSPKDLAIFMNAYFEALAQALKRHDVDVTEFHADTIMCAWTASEPQLSKRRPAVLAAIDAVRAIEEFARQQSLQLNPRIGLQDGYFYLGHTGGGGRLAYSILGDTANTAARLESLNKHLGTHILAAQSVVQDLDEVLIRPLGQFRLVGRAEATEIVEVLAGREAAGPEQLRLSEMFEDALATFAEQRWDKAAALFEALLEPYPDDGPAQFYLAQARRLATEGPSADDPTVIRMDAK